MQTHRIFRAFLLLLITLPGAVAFGIGEDNPTGEAGQFSGLIATGGTYDAFTGNVKRSITDLTVPGALGQTPLAFTRHFNSRGELLGPFGDVGAWTHSYQWELAIDQPEPVDNPALWRHTIWYPDGRRIVFWNGAPPEGVTDSINIDPTGNGTLYRSDGSTVVFQGKLAVQLVDSSGMITTLSYQISYLSRITEPGGRYLQRACQKVCVWVII